MHSQPDTGAPLVRAVDTPNPDARMFRVDEALIPTGTLEFSDPGRAASSPLAAALLALDGVELVLIAPRFVTVRKDPDADWGWLSPTVEAAIGAFLRSGEMAVLDDVVAKDREATSDVEERILAILDEEIRPAIAQDGGDVTYEGFVDGIVRLRLIGACGTCPSSTATLQGGIERMLMEEIPEVLGVESVA